MRTLVNPTKINIHKDAQILIWENVGMYLSLEHYLPYITNAIKTNQPYYYINEFRIILGYGICAVCVYSKRRMHPVDPGVYQVWAVPEGQYTTVPYTK